MWLSFVVLIFVLFPAPSWARVPDASEICVALKDAHPPRSEFDPWSSRARASGWMPQLRVGIESRQDDGFDSRFREQLSRVDDDLRFSSAQTDTLNAHDVQWKLDVSLIFDLDKVVFSRDELQADETARRALTYRIELCDRALALFFDWRKHSRLAIVASHAHRPLHAEDRDLAAARLDALTQGWFSRTLAQEVSR